MPGSNPALKLVLKTTHSGTTSTLSLSLSFWLDFFEEEPEEEEEEEEERDCLGLRKMLATQIFPDD